MIASPDPADLELQKIHQLIDLTNTVALDIGCGNGRTTILLAEDARQMLGLEIDRADLDTARRYCPPHLKSKMHWCQGRAEKLPFQNGQFDIVIFGWSL